MSERICFWTTYVQTHLISEVANELGISRSGACEWLIRRSLLDLQDDVSPLSVRLQKRRMGLRADHPMEWTRDLSRHQVDIALAPRIVDDIPY